MNKSLRSPTSNPFASAMWVCCSLAVLLAAQIALAGLAPPQDSNGGNTHAKWYIRSGQWRADARTLVAGVRFLFDLNAT